MPILRTTEASYGSPGDVLAESGHLTRRFEGHAVIPSSASSSIPLLDSLTGLPLVISATVAAPVMFHSIKGGIYNNLVTLSSAGVIKVAPNITTDCTPGGSTTIGATTRVLNTGLTTTPATTLPIDTPIFSSTPLPFAAAPITANTNLLVIPCNNDTTAASGAFMSSNANKPAIVMVTITVLARDLTRMSLAEFSNLPLSVQELLSR